MIKIIIGGDVCPMGSVESLFVHGEAGAIFHDLLNVIQDADLSVVNLECPLVSTPSPIKKPGTVLGAQTACFAGFAAAGWNVVNLANNHSFDHGVPGLLETMTLVEQSGLQVLGAGMNLQEAEKPYIRNINGRRVVLYAMAEREFSVADSKMPGANPLDLIRLVQAVQSYKQDGIFIVLLHGGVECYPYPSPEMVRRCRFMVDMGADAVICCHAHRPLPWELYKGRPIAYGMGNLVFEPPPTPAAGWQEGWYEGYLVRLTLNDSEILFESIPYSQSRTHLGVRKLLGDDEKRFFCEMQRRNDLLLNGAFLEEQWLDYCRRQADVTLAGLLGYNRLMWRFRKFFLNFLHSEKQMLCALNNVQCESHHEVISTLLRDRRKGKDEH
ncbi:MAG: CapA family protein [Syntrophobacteraceae bacterium]